MPKQTTRSPLPVVVEPSGEEPSRCQMGALVREMTKAMERFFSDPVIAADFERWKKEREGGAA